MGKHTERGTRGIFIGFPPQSQRGIFIGFPPNQKGYLIFHPGSRQILVSVDVLFDESFHAAIATTWQQYQDSFSLKPVASFVPDIDTTVEQTVTSESISTLVEEGTVMDTDPAPDPAIASSPPIDTINSTLAGSTDQAPLQEGNPDSSADTVCEDCEEDQSTSSTDSQLVTLESPPPEEPQSSPQIVDADPGQPELEGSLLSYKTSILPMFAYLRLIPLWILLPQMLSVGNQLLDQSETLSKCLMVQLKMLGSNQSEQS